MNGKGVLVVLIQAISLTQMSTLAGNSAPNTLTPTFSEFSTTPVHPDTTTVSPNPETSSSDPDTTVSPNPGTSSSDPDTTVSPNPETSSSDPDTTVSPSPGTSSSDPDTTVSPNPETSSSDPDTTVSPNPGTSSSDPDTTVSPNPETSSSDPDTTVSPNPETSSSDPDTTVSPNPETSSSDPDTTVSPNPETSSSDPDTTVSPNPETSSSDPDTTVSPNPGTSSSDPDTTVSPNPETSSSDPDTTVSPNPGTSSSDPDTTVSPNPETSSSDPDTTENLNLTLALIPPRTIIATWKPSIYSSVYCFCTIISEFQDCFETQATETEVRVPAGIIIYVVAFPKYPEIDMTTCDSIFWTTTTTQPSTTASSSANTTIITSTQNVTTTITSTASSPTTLSSTEKTTSTSTGTSSTQYIINAEEDFTDTPTSSYVTDFNSTSDSTVVTDSTVTDFNHTSDSTDVTDFNRTSDSTAFTVATDTDFNSTSGWPVVTDINSASDSTAATDVTDATVTSYSTIGTNTSYSKSFISAPDSSGTKDALISTLTQDSITIPKSSGIQKPSYIIASSRDTHSKNILRNSISASIAGMEKLIYIPWQLILGSTTSTSIILEWMLEENVTQICWRERYARDGYMECNMTASNSLVWRNLPPSTELEISMMVGLEDPLIIYTSTKSNEIYRSYAWQCNPNNLCCDDCTCFPATDGLLLPETNPMLVIPPTSYRYTCRHLSRNQSVTDPDDVHVQPSEVIKGRNGSIFIPHADFTDFSDSSIGEHLPFCSLPNALAMISYWCNGKLKCVIEHERLHSYFSYSEGCQSTNITKFELTVRNVNNSDWRCPEGFWMYNPQLTCYGTPDHVDVDFDSSRHKCHKLGGEIVYLSNDTEFLQFLSQKFPTVVTFWSLGISQNVREVRPPMLFSPTVDKIRVFNADGEFHVESCYDDCIDLSAATVCSLPPVGVNDFIRTDHNGSIPKSCNPGACQNGGTCLPVSPSPGLPGYNVSYMCHCRLGFSGLQCEVSNNSAYEEVLFPSDDIYEVFSLEDGFSIEYAYFGRNASNYFDGCYSPGALALMRLKCENQVNCSVSHRDLQNHLPSTCHPDIPQELRIRISYNRDGTDMGCEYDGELYSDTGTCFAVIGNHFATPLEAKIACNSLGGDLAFPYEDLVMCLKLSFSVWADESRHPGSPHFSMVPVSPVVLHCGNSSAKQNILALCEFPPVPLSLPITTSTTTETTSFETTSVSTTSVTSTSVSTTQMPPTPEPITDCPRTRPFPSLYPEYIWESSKPNTLTSQKCPEGSDVTNSNVTWFCGHLGEWIDLPDMSDCRLLDLGGWESELNDTSSGTTAGDTLERIATNITDNLSAGDVIGLVKLMDIAQQRHKKDLQNATGSEEVALNITHKYTNSLTNISSIILEKTSVWEGIPVQPRFLTGSRLQENVESAAVEVSLLLRNRTEAFNHNAISVLAQQYPSDYYTESKNRIFAHPKFGSSRVILPSDFYSVLPDKERVAVTFTSYNTLHCILSEGAACSSNSDDSDFIMEGLVNSPVMGLTVGNTSWRAPEGSEGVIITFTHLFLNSVYNLTEEQCVWWDIENSVWLPDRCSLINTTLRQTFCSCDHLTNLAVIMDVNGRLPEFILVITKWVTIVGCSISLVCLFLTIVTMACLVKNHKYSSTTTLIIHINFCCSLFMAEVVLLAGLDATQTKAGCAVVAALLHYLLLTTFCWMGVEGFNVYMLFIKVFDFGRTRMKLYSLFAYGVPLLIVSISLGVTKAEGYGTKGYCWLDYETGLTWAFTAPALIILLMNLVIFGLSVKVLRELSESGVPGVSSGSRKNKGGKEDVKKNKTVLKTSFILTMTMGITWLLGFTLIFEGMEWMAVIFTIVNSLQGVGLFATLILFSKKGRSQFGNLIPWQIRKIGIRWYEIWYPHGKRGESTYRSTSGDSSSRYNKGNSNSFKLTETHSTVSGVSGMNLPMDSRGSIDHRGGSSELEV